MKKESLFWLQDRTQLLDALWIAQNQHGHIRDEDVRAIAQKLDISTIEVEGVLSFYHFFHRKPSGRFTIYLNNSIISECQGFERVKAAFERETGALFGHTDATGQFGLYETSCIGLSDQEPAALINFYPFTNLNAFKVRHIIAELKKGAAVKDLADTIDTPVFKVGDEEKMLFFRPYEAGQTVKKLSQYTPEKIITELKRSGLRGMGGAFFPTGLKWELCRKESKLKKYIVCNADEGEPGTFKDRILLQKMPGLLLEGMIYAAYASGAQDGVIYLRAEYLWLKHLLDKAISHFYNQNWLGHNILGVPGFHFDIRIQVGAGAYVCGEETAMLNSMEGNRGEPRIRQFFPTEKGFIHHPTIVNNVETFCAAARIMELGADFFLSVGTPTSPGTKLISISGDCVIPGIYEIEWGAPVARLLDLCQAKDPWMIQLSGPSGECISMEEKDRLLALDDLPCGGAFMIFDDQRDLLKIFHNYSRFFKSESCGICTPCRAGNFIIQRKLEKIGPGMASPTDFEDIRAWGKIMEMSSRCGLGKTATKSLVMAMDKFPDYFKKKIDPQRKGINTAFNLEKATEEYEKFNN